MNDIFTSSYYPIPTASSKPYDTFSTWDYNNTAASKPYHHNITNIISGLIETICFTIGAPGSALILSYFISKWKDKTASTFMYICITFTDLIICLLILSCAISDFNYEEPMLFSNKHYCNVWGLVWVVSSNMSIFLIAVLSVARTVSLTFPFWNVKRIHVAILVILYFLTLLIEYSLAFLFESVYGQNYGYNQGYHYSDNICACLFYIDSVFDYKTLEYWAFIYWVYLVNNLLPFLLIVMSCCVSVYKLRSDGSNIRNNNEGQIKRDATITIVIFTVVYIIFNAPLCMYWTVRMSNKEALQFIFEVLGYNGYYTVLKFLTFNSVALNSMFNVVIYFWRMTDLQHYVRDIAGDVRGKLGSFFQLRRVIQPDVVSPEIEIAGQNDPPRIGEIVQTQGT